MSREDRNRVSIAMKCNVHVTSSIDVRLVHNNKLIGNNSHLHWSPVATLLNVTSQQLTNTH